MLKVKYSKSAEQTIEHIADFIENINTKSAGKRWKEQFNKKIHKYAVPVAYPLCRHIKFALKNYSCISIYNWIIIFKIEHNIFYVYSIIHSSILR